MTIKNFLVVPIAFAFAFAGLGTAYAQAIPMLRITTVPITNSVIVPSANGGANDAILSVTRLDARESSDDIRIEKIPVDVTFGNGATSAHTSDCRIYDSRNMSVPLNDNGMRLNERNNVIELDDPLIVPRGEMLLLTVRCDLSASTPVGATFLVIVDPLRIDARDEDGERLVFSPMPGYTGTVLTYGRGPVTTRPPSTTTPGFPNTGAGGEAALNLLLLGTSAAAAILGLGYLRKLAR